MRLVIDKARRELVLERVLQEYTNRADAPDIRDHLTMQRVVDIVVPSVVELTIDRLEELLG